MANILLIGGTGCVGTATSEALLKRQPKANIYQLTRRAAQSQGSSPFSLVQGDILDKSSLLSALRENSITHVLHGAALRTTDCAQQPALAYQMNVLGTQNVIDAIHKHGGVERLVYTSTAAIYAVDDGMQFDVTEDSPKELLNPYTATKFAGEALLEGHAHHSGQATTILRPQIIYGPHRLSEGSTAGISVAINKAKLGEKFTIPFGGTTGFHYSADVGMAHAMALLESPEHFACYNLPAESLSIASICERLNSLAGAQLIDHHHRHYPFPAGLDSRRFETAFPSFTRTSFDQAIELA